MRSKIWVSEKILREGQTKRLQYPEFWREAVRNEGLVVYEENEYKRNTIKSIKEREK